MTKLPPIFTDALRAEMSNVADMGLTHDQLVDHGAEASIHGDWLRIAAVAGLLYEMEVEASVPDLPPVCLDECDEHHAEGCPVYAAEDRYWMAYFGLRNDMTRQQWNDQLDRMRPVGMRAREEDV